MSARISLNHQCLYPITSSWQNSPERRASFLTGEKAATTLMCQLVLLPLLQQTFYQESCCSCHRARVADRNSVSHKGRKVLKRALGHVWCDMWYSLAARNPGGSRSPR